MTTTAGGAGGAHCTAAGLAETGSAATWPLALGVLALAAGALLMRLAHRRTGNGNWSRP
jgi:LPXTG-motif cell wall-anchored protein